MKNLSLLFCSLLTATMLQGASVTIVGGGGTFNPAAAYDFTGSNYFSQALFPTLNVVQANVTNLNVIGTAGTGYLGVDGITASITNRAAELEITNAIKLGITRITDWAQIQGQSLTNASLVRGTNVVSVGGFTNETGTAHFQGTTTIFDNGFSSAGSAGTGLLTVDGRVQGLVLLATNNPTFSVPALTSGGAIWYSNGTLYATCWTGTSTNTAAIADDTP